jgi:lipopolysaccharide transport system permease protein
MNTGIRELAVLVAAKVQMNLKSEASRSYLSYLWWVLEPALMVLVFYVVFGLFLARKTDNFVVFLVCGQIPFLWFSRTVGNSAESIRQGRGLMHQVNVPKVFFPLVVICQDAVKFSAVFFLMLLIVILGGGFPDWSWLSLPLVVVTELVFIASVSILCAMLVPFLPDLRFIISTMLTLTLLASGIFYNYKDVILPVHQDLFLLNPMASIIGFYRDVLLDNRLPDFRAMALILVTSLMVLALLLRQLSRLEGIYPRVVSE